MLMYAHTEAAPCFNSGLSRFSLLSSTVSDAIASINKLDFVQSSKFKVALMPILHMSHIQGMERTFPTLPRCT